jgi:hypothetical protein
MHFNLLPVLSKCARQVQELQQQGRITPDLQRVIQAGGIMPVHANMGALPAMGFNWQQQQLQLPAAAAQQQQPAAPGMQAAAAFAQPPAPAAQQYMVETPDGQQGMAAAAQWNQQPANPYLPFGGFHAGMALIRQQAVQQTQPHVLMAGTTRAQARLSELQEHQQRISKLSSFQPGSSATASADPNTAAGGRPPGDSCSSNHGPPKRAYASEEHINEQMMLMRHLKLLTDALDANLREQTAAAAAAVTAEYQQQAVHSSVGSSGVITQFAEPERLYTPKPMDLAHNRRAHRSLYTIDQPAAGQSHCHLEMPDGRKIKIKRNIQDDGCNPGLITQVTCQRSSIPITAEDLPTVSMIDNTKAAIIGRTPPMWIVIGESTSRPLRKWLPNGLLVIAGDGGGTYDVILGTDTLREYFFYVDPLHQHLCWYPDAPEGKFTQLNGVPVSIHASYSISAASSVFAGAAQLVHRQPAEPAALAAAADALEEGTLEAGELDAGVLDAGKLDAGALEAGGQLAECSSQLSAAASPTCSEAAVAAFDSLLNPASAAKAAAARSSTISSRIRRGISSIKCLQQVSVFLVLLCSAVFFSPVAAMMPRPLSTALADQFQQQEQQLWPTHMMWREYEAEQAARPALQRSRFRCYGPSRR